MFLLEFLGVFILLHSSLYLEDFDAAVFQTSISSLSPLLYWISLEKEMDRDSMFFARAYLFCFSV